MRERTGAHAPPLSQRGVHVWRANVADHAGERFELASLLDAHERERVTRFRFPVDRVRFEIAHGLVRRIVSSYADCSPQSIVFTHGAFGKPGIVRALHAEPLTYNLSHSADVVAIAVARCAVGIDVETWSGDYCEDELARSVFSPAEQRQLARTPVRDKRAAFIAGWTRKEAYVKATGLGLSAGLTSFDVSLDPLVPALLADRTSPLNALDWVMYDVPVRSRFSACVVVERGADAPLFFDTVAERHASWR